MGRVERGKRRQRKRGEIERESRRRRVRGRRRVSGRRERGRRGERKRMWERCCHPVVLHIAITIAATNYPPPLLKSRLVNIKF